VNNKTFFVDKKKTDFMLPAYKLILAKMTKFVSLGQGTGYRSIFYNVSTC